MTAEVARTEQAFHIIINTLAQSERVDYDQDVPLESFTSPGRSPLILHIWCKIRRGL